VTVKVIGKKIRFRSYQTITLPNGGAPLAVRREFDNEFADASLFCIDPGSAGETVFGLFMIHTDNEFPKDLRVFPEEHKLLNQVLAPNARYVDTVDGWHVFLGNPRTEEKE
jgi:hypothetical protein